MRNDPTPLDPEEQDDLLLQITLVLSQALPENWQETTVTYRALGSHNEMVGRVQGKGQPAPTSYTPPPDLAQRFERLRAGMYRPDTGTWYTAVYTLTQSSTAGYSVSYDRENKPAWVAPPPMDCYDEELRTYPRDPAHTPTWLGGQATPGQAPLGQDNAPPPGPAKKAGRATRRRAEIFIAKPFDGTDPNGTPIFQRPPVPPGEYDAVVRYLEDAPVILAARSFSEDMLAPGRPVNVPLTYQTDGTWVWAGAVGYYLRVHGAPPQPELVTHIRGNGYQRPELPEDVQTFALENLYHHFQSEQES